MTSLPTAGKEARNAPKGDSVHPRPQLARAAWLSLDGSWQLHRIVAVERDRAFGANGIHPGPWTETIQVPFAPEAPLSGIGDERFQPVLWYRREFRVPGEWRGQRIRLHFGAVDYRATVWVNGALAVRHEGGYTPFEADITELLKTDGAGPDGGLHELIVLAEDDPSDMGKPRGKQDWQAEPHSIWYPRTTGIWQSVWLEPVPETRIERMRIVPDLAGFSVHVEVEVAGCVDGLALDVSASLQGRELVADRWSVPPPANGKAVGGDVTVARTIALPDPGIDDARRAFLWSPEHPALIDLDLALRRDGREIDRVRSYTALREVGVQGGHFVLNGRPYFLRLALDQGYWPDGHLTPPSDDALRRDVELAKALGFNGVRKHQKLEDPRWLYWADRLGLLVWAEMPSAYAFSARAVERLTHQCIEAIARDRNHPCIVAWVLFNESWGVPDLPASAPQRDAVRGLYRLAKALDPTRPAVGNDGWEHLDTDLFTVHDYARDPEVLRRRYGDAGSFGAQLARVRPAGRTLVIEGDIPDAPMILSEFGGIRFHATDDLEGWGYHEVASAQDLLARYSAMVAVASGEALAGFCYTQFADTFQEQNGLLNADRSPKLPPEEIARATRNEGRDPHPPTSSA